MVVIDLLYIEYLLRQLDVGETLGVYFYQNGGSAQVDLAHLVNSTSALESIFGGHMITDVKSRRAEASAAAGGNGGGGGKGEA